ncbi:hypothetical protein [Salinicoccus kekensis]|uniref:Uncharacterized protein n=1 Tax=Salinicoccus kekensis TaxID=714307 RepID=A0A285UBG8_9STAP|nr:hypothetical protein [Salinicoccus kekensis]SOC39037.1 hypothetical protein SAMN05878391_0683 [Salinicoccus kekensis]
MHLKQYSKSQISKASEKLESVNKTPCCETPDKEIMPEITQLIAKTDQSQIIGMDMMTIKCNHCGLVEQYDPVVLGAE